MKNGKGRVRVRNEQLNMRNEQKSLRSKKSGMINEQSSLRTEQLYYHQWTIILPHIKCGILTICVNILKDFVSIVVVVICITTCFTNKYYHCCRLHYTGGVITITYIIDVVRIVINFVRTAIDWVLSFLKFCQYCQVSRLYHHWFCHYYDYVVLSLLLSIPCVLSLEIYVLDSESFIIGWDLCFTFFFPQFRWPWWHGSHGPPLPFPGPLTHGRNGLWQGPQKQGGQVLWGLWR